MHRFKETALASAIGAGRQLSATNRINSQGELLLYGVIGDWFDSLDAATVISELESLSGDNTPLTVRIHSDGGFITEGLAIYNALVNSQRRVEIRIDGIALSMASVIATSPAASQKDSSAWRSPATVTRQAIPAMTSATSPAKTSGSFQRRHERHVARFDCQLAFGPNRHAHIRPRRPMNSHGSTVGTHTAKPTTHFAQHVGGH